MTWGQDGGSLKKNGHVSVCACSVRLYVALCDTMEAEQRTLTRPDIVPTTHVDTGAMVRRIDSTVMCSTVAKCAFVYTVLTY